MCIIMFQQGGSTERWPREHLLNAEAANSDGGGIMWAHSNKLHIYRSLDDADGLWRRYCSARDVAAPVALHFRIRTHGDVSESNCHPFVIQNLKGGAGPYMAVMHNGIVGDMGGLPDGMSDTRHFTEAVLRKMPLDFLASDAITAVLQRGSSGKFLFMTASGAWRLFRAEGGSWEKKNTEWFSNYSFRRPRYVDHRSVCGHGGSTRWYKGIKIQGMWDKAEKKWIDKFYDQQTNKWIPWNLDETGDDDDFAGFTRGRVQIEGFGGTTSVPSHLPASSKYKPKVASKIVLDKDGKKTYKCEWCDGNHLRGSCMAKEIKAGVLLRPDSWTERHSEDALETGALHNGIVYCWNCMPIEMKNNGDKVEIITLPILCDLLCANCDELLYEWLPSDDVEGVTD